MFYYSSCINSLDYLCSVAGSKLQNLVGNVEFVNTSFYYPSRPTVSSILKYMIWLIFSDSHVSDYPHGLPLRSSHSVKLDKMFIKFLISQPSIHCPRSIYLLLCLHIDSIFNLQYFYCDLLDFIFLCL